MLANKELCGFSYIVMVHVNNLSCTNSGITHCHAPCIAQVILQPPESTTAALGTNATFSCRGNRKVLWEINGTQVTDASQVPMFSSIICVFVPLPKDSSSELIVTASIKTNASLEIVCVVQPRLGVQPWSSNKSSPVHLLVYGKSAQSCL